MTRKNVSHTHRRLSNRDEAEQVFIDGDSVEAIFRVLVDDNRADEFEQFVEDELDGVSVTRSKWVDFGVEVTVQ